MLVIARCCLAFIPFLRRAKRFENTIFMKLDINMASGLKAEEWVLKDLSTCTHSNFTFFITEVIKKFLRAEL